MSKRGNQSGNFQGPVAYSSCAKRIMGLSEYIIDRFSNKSVAILYEEMI